MRKRSFGRGRRMAGAVGRFGGGGGWFGIGLLFISAGGCGGDALVEISAADAIEALTAQTRIALDEYQADLESGDDAREADVIAAFVRRAQQDASDSTRMEAHGQAFGQALARLRADRRTAWRRHTNAEENVKQMEAIARDLRQLAMDSLTLSDDWQRFFGRLIDAQRRARESAAATGPSSP
ncbi:MAG: hypothetical protein V3T70_00800 [Phycisphaerae bacterium]